MTLRSKVRLWMLCVALGACSGSKQHTSDADIDDEADAGEVIDDSIEVGDPVDLDGDGKLDGEAVDTNGDGIPDGVDTNGDGSADAPLPSTSNGNLDAGMTSVGGDDAG